MTRKKLWALVLTMVAVGGYIGAGQVSAIGNNFFDMVADANGECDTLNWAGTVHKCSNPARLMVGETNTVLYARVEAKAYFRGASPAAIAAYAPTISVPGWQFCPGAKWSWNSNDERENGYFENNTPPTGVPLTDFRIGGTLRGSAQYRGASSSYCDSSHPNFIARWSVPASALKPVRGVDNLFSVTIEILHNRYRGGTCTAGGAWTYCDGMYNAMGLWAGSNNNAVTNPLITNIESTGLGGDVRAGNAVTLQNYPVAQSDANSTSYRLRFGSDCTVRAPGVTKSVQFYDLDYYPNSNAGYEPIRVRLHKQRRVAVNGDLDGRWLTPYTTNTWQVARPTYSKNLAHDNSYPQYAQLMLSRNNAISNFNFYAQPGYIYFVDVLNNNNGLVFQYGLPFDAVYYFNACTESVEPSAGFGVSRAIAGDTINATASIENTGDAAITATYRREFWYSADSDWSAGPGTNIQAPLTANEAVNGNTTDNLPAWSTTVNGAYRYICTKLTITAPAPAKSDGQCIPIGKYPSLQVLGGDVRSGGAVPQGVLCNVFGDGSIKGRPSTADLRGSLGQYAVLASGGIDAFGSGGFYTANTSSNQFYFGSKSAYSVSPPADDGYFYLDRTGSPGDPSPQAHCLPALDGVYPSTGASVPIVAGANVTIDIPANNVPVMQERTFAPNSSGGVSTLNITANAGTAPLVLPPGKRVAIRVNGPAICDNDEKYIVRIASNVRYNGGGGTISAAPWFSIIATSPCIRLVVADTVTELYGLYATEGEIMTCAADGTGYDDIDDTPLTTDACTSRLTVNGAVVAGTRLHTYRTFGDGAAGNAAEVFNLDPMFTISDYVRSRETKTFRIENQLELPPRF